MRKTLATTVTALVLALSASCASASSELVGWWRLNEGSGIRVADSSGSGNHGVLQGAAKWVPGVFGTALSFDGNTGRVSVPRNASLEPATTIAVATWVRATNPGNFKYIVSKGGSGCSAASYGLYTGPYGGVMFYVAGDSGLSYTRSPDGGTGVWNGRWHFIAGTYDGSAVRLYVDGSQIGSGTPRTGPISYGLPTSNDLFIGHYEGCPGLDFAGTIDDPNVWGGRGLGEEANAKDL
jgi:hypothetical protein